MLGMSVVAGLIGLVAMMVAVPEGWADMSAGERAEADASYVLGYEMEMLDGSMKALADYEGSVIMIVNTASLCGLTPQYEGLQNLYAEKKDAGLVVLGFPCNQFGRQEPGSSADIAAFCSKRFEVEFPMFAKVDVKGDGAAPLYARLVSQPEPIGGEPQWNFTKFLVDRSGRVVARFGPRTAPDDAELVAAIDGLLAVE